MAQDPTILWAFLDDQVAQLTGLSTRQIRYWRDTGFYLPSSGPDSLFYSFRDIVALRTVAMLRSRRVPLQELRKVGEWLKEWTDQPWSSLRLYLGGRKVYLQDPKTGTYLTRLPKNQTCLPVSLEAIASDAQAAVEASRARQESDVGKVDHSRKVMGNATTVAGTRVPTAAIWNLRDAGYSNGQIIAEYPGVTAADIDAALAYEKNARASRKRRPRVA